MLRPLLLLAMASTAVISGCENPQHELDQTADILALGESMNNMQTYIDQLEERIDSLQVAIIRQDSTIARIAAFTGLVLPDRRY